MREMERLIFTTKKKDTGTDIVDSNGFLQCFGHTGTQVNSC